MLTLLVSCSKPVANFVMIQDDSVVPTTIRFENTSTEAESYTWVFGDGNTSNELNSEHRYLLSGKYEIQLIAKKGNKQSVKKKEVVFSAPEICLVEMETNFGSMLIQLYDETFKHRDNFIKLAEQGYYEGLLFHRVIDGFMIQGGDPKSKNAIPGAALGNGGPGYKIDAEILPQYGHIKGALAAARQGDNVNPEKKSSGSQFYIVHGKALSKKDVASIESRKGFDYPVDLKEAYIQHGGTPFLDREYTVFGRVINGLEIVDAIAKVSKDRRDRPEENVIIKRVSVIK